MFQYERFTSAHSLRWETPYLDRSVVEFLASLPQPEHLKAEDAAKHLRALLRPTFPPSIVDRPKSPRPHFLNEWATTQPLYTLFSLLSKGILVETGIVSETWINRQLESPEQMKKAFSYLWSILILEVWFRLFIHGNLDSEPPSLTTEALLREK